jgi:hypothetical protein
MSSDWVFNSVSQDENIELIYCSAVLESCPPQYVFSIKMKSGQILSFHDSHKYANLFNENDILAIKAAEENLNTLYEKEDKLYFNEDAEGYELTKNVSFRKPTVIDKILNALTPCKTIDSPVKAKEESESESESEEPPKSMYKRIKNNCSVQ